MDGRSGWEVPLFLFIPMVRIESFHSGFIRVSLQSRFTLDAGSKAAVNPNTNETRIKVKGRVGVWGVEMYSMRQD